MQVDINELDIFFISYDEPNCEDHWADLLRQYPWANRVHGVKGFDEAHKICAQNSMTERFITVDGDTIVYPEFANVTVDVPDEIVDTAVLSWTSENAVNGLRYGNGGIKCWPVNTTLEMNTHENSDSEGNEVEFCWALPFLQFDQCMSKSFINGSPYQAFRAGYREGVKMMLDRGSVIDISEIHSRLWNGNIRRFIMWACVGHDVPNGIWSILGARKGAVDLFINKIDHTKIADYDWMIDMFDDYHREHKDDLYAEYDRLGEIINDKLDIPLTYSRNDATLRYIYENPERRGMQNAII